MNFVWIYISPESPEITIEQASAHIFATLGLSNNEERYSDNYEHGHYFVGYATNGSLSVMHLSEYEKEFPFCASIESARSWRLPEKPINLTLDPADIARALAQQGMRTFVPIGNDGRIDWDRRGTVYSRDHPDGQEMTLKV